MMAILTARAGSSDWAWPVPAAVAIAPPMTSARRRKRRVRIIRAILRRASGLRAAMLDFGQKIAEGYQRGRAWHASI